MPSDATQVDQADADVARRGELLAINPRSPEQEAELDRLNVAIRAREDAAAQAPPPPNNPAWQPSDPVMAPDSAVVDQGEGGDLGAEPAPAAVPEPVVPAPDLEARQKHAAELGAMAGNRLAASAGTAAALERALGISAAATTDAAAAADAAKAAVAAANAAETTNAPNAKELSDTADLAVAKAKAMAEAAGLATTSALAAGAYDAAAKSAAETSAAAQAAFADAVMAENTNSPDVATKIMASQAADVTANASYEAADKAAATAGDAAKAADEALANARTPAMNALPGEHQTAFAELRAWVRREIELAMQGHSPEERAKTLNP